MDDKVFDKDATENQFIVGQGLMVVPVLNATTEGVT
jgi:hypothetical protein